MCLIVKNLIFIFLRRLIKLLMLLRRQNRSNIDLAVVGGDYRGFKYDVNDNAQTLLIFDIVNYSQVSSRLREGIDRYGKLIYKKA